MIFNYFEEEKKLLYYEHDAEEIPDEIIAEFRNKEIMQIDFSSNSLVSLNFISYFSNLREIILDNNFLSDTSHFPVKVFHSTHLLSLNNNKFENLDQLILNICHTFPNISYLSLLGNPLCPALNEHFNENENKNYRLFIISRMFKLKFLDARMITTSELSSIHSNTSAISGQKSLQTEVTSTMDRMSLWKKIFKSTSPHKESQVVGDNNRKCYTPLPTDDNDVIAPHTPRSTYGKVKHYYKGNESQGNRFISNTML